MVVKCINAKHTRGLTNGKKYKVYGKHSEAYTIENDRGFFIIVRKENFIKMNWLWNLLIKMQNEDFILN